MYRVRNGQRQVRVDFRPATLCQEGYSVWIVIDDPQATPIVEKRGVLQSSADSRYH